MLVFICCSKRYCKKISLHLIEVMNTLLYHIKGVTKAIEFVTKGKYLLFFIPGAILTIIYLYFSYIASSIGESVVLASDYSWLDWIAGYVNSAIDAAFSVFSAIFSQIYIFFVITLLSPFNTYLGEKLEEELTGRKTEGGLVRFITDFFRMVLVVIIILIIEYGIMAVFSLFSWVFGLSFLNEFVYWIMSAFFFGFSFYDFALERDKIGVFSSLGFAFQKPLTMTLTGGIFLIVYAIPVAGIPIAPVLTLMISTVVYLYIKKRLPLKNNELKIEKHE